MPSNTISQRIALEGADDVKRQLDDLGAAGEKAVNQIQSAASSGSGGLSAISSLSASIQSTFSSVSQAFQPVRAAFSELGGSVKEFGSSLKELGSNVFPHFEELVTIGIAAAVVEFARLITESNESVNQLRRTAESLGLTTEQYQRLSLAAAQAGVDTDKMVAALGRFTRSLANAQDEQRKAVVEIGEQLIGSLTAGVEVLHGAQKSQADFAKQAADSQRLIKVFVDDNSQATAIAIQLYNELAKAGNTFGQTVFTLTNLIKDADKGSGAAAVKFRELMAAAGQRLPAQNALEALAPLIDKNRTAFDKLGIQLFDINTKTFRSTADVFGDLAVKLAAMEDTTKRNQIVFSEFGRSGLQLIPLFKDIASGSGSAKQQFVETALAAIKVGEANKEAAKGFEETFATMSTVVSSARNRIGVALGEAFIPVFETITQLIIKNIDAIQRWANSMSEELKPVILDIVKLFQGAADEDIGSKWLITARNAVLELRDVFLGLVGVLNTIADTINSVFGTHLTAASIAAILIIGQLSGAFAVLVAGISVLTAAFTVLGTIVTGIAALLSLPAILVAVVAGAVVAAAILIIENWGRIGPALKEGWSDFASFVTASIGVVVNTFRDAWAGAVVFYNAIVGGLGKTFVEAWSAIQNFDPSKFFADQWRNTLSLVRGWWDDALKSFGDLAAGIARLAGDAVKSFTDLWTWGIKFVEGLWDQLTTFIGDKVSAALDFIQPLLDAIKAVASGIGGNGGAAGAAVGASFAGGGLIRGPGGPTEDRVPLWGSAGEFMLRAKAVRHYGVNVIQALNEMRIQIPQAFAMGGLITGPPGSVMLAAGGSVPSSVPINLNILGQGLGVVQAGEDAARKLVRFARGQRVTSAGVKPWWHNG